MRTLILTISILLLTAKCTFSQNIVFHYGDTSYMDSKKSLYGTYYVMKSNLQDGYYVMKWGNSDNTKESGNYLSGMKEGTHLTYYSNGLPHEICYYSRGRKEGFQFIYYSYPSYLLNLSIYCNDSLTGNSYDYFENGEIKNKYTYRMGIPADTTVFYYSPGSIRMMEVFDSTSCFSEQFNYYENGVLKSHGFWCSKTLCGNWYYYDECGNLLSLLVYNENLLYPILVRHYFMEEPYLFTFPETIDR